VQVAAAGVPLSPFLPHCFSFFRKIPVTQQAEFLDRISLPFKKPSVFPVNSSYTSGTSSPLPFMLQVTVFLQ